MENKKLQNDLNISETKIKKRDENLLFLETFLKDLFQASMMHGVEYCAIAVRNIYQAGKSKDFEKITTFIETMYASERLHLPLKGILLIGY
jgi:protein-tyrosine phosphatase